MSSETLQPLLDRLEKARFTGRLELDIYRGEVIAAELKHSLAKTEFTGPLAIIQSEETEAKR